ncbi:V-type ATP synthase subunit D [Actinoallomurus sp. NBC_01490]|uniref:V-type ATP synthase subunit D n=1 Tax=Actinoallomurus sp. NBC_01490 TaxID=2903557 RepID=UPI002E333D6F|nr:V-type ATP synthase subunit D [Actinoallomurus sp. NBC_01490]
MTTLARVPPGRAGRLWLRRRLKVARRGVDLLQRELRVLVREHHRLASVAERTAQTWTAACAEADMWALRACLADGRRVLRPAPPAHVTVRWEETMGLRFPVDATCTPAEDPTPMAASAALSETRKAAWTALQAAVDHAVAREAERRVSQQITVIRQRIRALQDRWIPRLTAALRQIDLAIEEAERADAARLLRIGRLSIERQNDS